MKFVQLIDPFAYFIEKDYSLEVVSYCLLFCPPHDHVNVKCKVHCWLYHALSLPFPPFPPLFAPLATAVTVPLASPAQCRPPYLELVGCPLFLVLNINAIMSSPRIHRRLRSIPLYAASVERNELSLCIIFAVRGTAALLRSISHSNGRHGGPI